MKREPKKCVVSNLREEKVVEVAAGLIFRNGQLLITRRHSNVHLGGLWEFPGGKREDGETFEQCLVRELKEELGVQVRVVELFESLTHEYPQKTVKLRFFVCSLEAGEPRALDCSAVEWVRREGLGNYEFPAADAVLLKKLGEEKIWRQASNLSEQ